MSLSIVLTIYAVGVAIGLLVMRDPIGPRLAVALVWPLGPVAFVVVVTLLLAAAVIIWPLVMLPAIAALAALAWLVILR